MVRKGGVRLQGMAKRKVENGMVQVGELHVTAPLPSEGRFFLTPGV